MPLSHRLPRHPRFTPMRDRGCLHLTNLPSFEQRCSESEREQERQLAHTWYQFTCGFVNPALVSKCGRWAVVLWLQLNHDSNIHHLSKGDPWIICVGSWNQAPIILSSFTFHKTGGYLVKRNRSHDTLWGHLNVSQYLFNLRPYMPE